MKTKLFLLASAAFSMFCKAQNVTIPDPIFKSYLVNNLAINTNGDSQIQVSEATAFTGVIDCSSKNISSLTGIEAFVNITQLSCFGNSLTILDVSKNTALKILVCTGNQLTALDVSKNLALKELNFSANKLTSIDISKNTVLSFFAFYGNLITTVDVTKNTLLESLVCDNNLLTNLDLSKNTLLKNLDCSSNNITTLDLTKNAALEMLSVSLNPFTALDLTKNAALSILNAVGNNFTILDLSKNSALLSLDLSNGKLTSLDISQNKVLEGVFATNNQLTSANLKNTNNAGLFYVDITGNPNLTCIQVDDVTEANGYTSSELWLKDNVASYNTNCSNTLNATDVYKNTIKIFPNPAKSILNWSVKADVEIYNSVGQKVITSKNSSSTNISKLSNGVYIVIIKDENGKEIQRSKIIKD